MVVNNNNRNTGNRVRFISYTGDYPNLCHGVLTLEIDGKEYKFGHNYSNYHYDANGKGIFTDEDPANPNFDSFWMSGGCITGGMEDLHAETGEWEIDADDLPEQFRELADEIDLIFNENVDYGCCGGCI
jgi:hypothetical protein